MAADELKTQSELDVQVTRRSGEKLDRDEEVYVASQWRLMWWRFKKHRLAMISLALLVFLYVVSINAEFIETAHPRDTNKSYTFLQPQPIRWFDNGTFRPHVNSISGVRNMETFRVEYTKSETEKIPVNFFVKGHEYKWLGFIKSRVHLFGLPPTGKKANGDYTYANKRQSIFPWGSDNLGRDLFSRTVSATRISMSIGLVGVAISFILGVLFGGVSGYYGGLPDIIIQRFIEFLNAIPTLPLWMALSAALPLSWPIVRVYFAIVVILSLFGWTGLARVVRSKFLSLREEDYVMAARLAGASEMRIMFRHMLPGFMSHIIAQLTLAIPGMIIGETSLSFLGLGLRPPAISWGVLLQAAQNIQTIALHPWLMIPALAVIVAVLVFNFFGDGLRDAADPYAK